MDMNVWNVHLATKIFSTQHRWDPSTSAKYHFLFFVDLYSSIYCIFALPACVFQYLFTHPTDVKYPIIVAGTAVPSILFVPYGWPSRRPGSLELPTCSPEGRFHVSINILPFAAHPAFDKDFLTETLLHSVHCLPVAARVMFETLILACKAQNGSAPLYLMAVVIKPRCIPPALPATSTARLDLQSFKTYGRQASRPFSFLPPRWWNDLPLAVPTADSLVVLKHKPRIHFFMKHLSEH